MISRDHDGPIRWSFVVPDLTRPAGGLFAFFHLANALAQRGDRVHLVHLASDEANLTSIAEIPWFSFDPGVEHHFLARPDPDLVPAGDILLYTVKTVATCRKPGAGSLGRQMVERLQADTSPSGIPMLFLQALGVFSPEDELIALRGPGPKVCVAGWMAENLVRAGFSEREVVHVPNGLDHETFNVRAPIDGRPTVVAMNYNPHTLKNMEEAVDALGMIQRRCGVSSVLFGSAPPPSDLPSGITYVTSPSQERLADTIYPGASIYLQPSTQEGFGLCALEAMACGCALVTTDNGGSWDYAEHDRTAVVCEPDAEAMARAVAELIGDDDRRRRIAANGVEHVERFQWSTSAARLREVASAYLAAPSRFRSGEQSDIDPTVRVLHR